MAQTTVVIPGCVEASTVYAGGVLVARNETVNLPEVTRKTFTQKFAGGEQDIPSIALEDMEMSISKNGLNDNTEKFINEPDIEVRWVQTDTATDGTITRSGYKAFMKTLPVTLSPGTSVEVGSGTENDLTKKALSFSVYKDGKELVNINKLTGAQRIDGVEYGISDSML